MKVSINTRTLEPGDVFIPIKGPTYDGHDFIEEAIRKGASRILDVDLTAFARQFRQKLGCQVIAVTGSAGKTTVKDMLYYTLQGPSLSVVRTLENQNNNIGVPLTVLSADSTTDVLIVELAMRHRGEIAALTKIVRPTMSIVTGIGLTHASELSNQKRIAYAKAEIFQKPLLWESAHRFAFINHETPYYDLLSGKAHHAGYKIFPYTGQDKPEQNLALCYLVGRHFGLSDEQISQNLKRYVPSSHRQVIKEIKGVQIIDDTYNANPDGMLYALQILRRFKGRKIVVAGDMLELGLYSREAHQMMVENAVDAGVEILYGYGSELAKVTSEVIPLYRFENKSDLLAHLLPEVKVGDVILVKGSRGMHMEEVVEGLYAFLG